MRLYTSWVRVTPATQEKVNKELAAFVEQIAPLFRGRAITYVDIGAFTGSVYAGLRSAGLRIHDAHLVEPNPRLIDELTQRFDGDHRVVAHNLAVGDADGEAHLELRDSMTRIVSEPGSRASAVVQVTSLDALMARQGVEHVHLLKVDVEGHELDVLAGAGGLLSAQAVDVIYIEAGMSGESAQQVHHRDIELVLEAHGYRLMGVFEQVHEWIQDLPTLRRANLGFVSQKFAESHPFRLSRELQAAEQRIDELTRERNALAASIDEAEAALSRPPGSSAARELSTPLGAAIERLRHDRDAYLAWGVETELRLNRVTRSRWWRITRYPRGAVRRIRTRLGLPTMGPVSPVRRPSESAAPVVTTANPPDVQTQPPAG